MKIMNTIKIITTFSLCILLMCSLCSCNGNKNDSAVNDEENNTDITDNEQESATEQDINSADGAENSENTEEPSVTEPETQIKSATKADIFISETYYLEGTVYSGYESMPIRLATNGNNLQFTTDFAVGQSEIVFSLMRLDEVTYVTLPEKQIYTMLNEELIATMGLEGVFDITEFRTTENEEGTVTQSEVTINEESGLCTTYTFTDTKVDIYSVDDKLVRIDYFDEYGQITMSITVDSISAQIPSDQLTISGYTEADTAEFFSLLVG